MSSAVPRLNLTEAILDCHPLPVRRRRHVAVRKCVGQKPVRRLELARELADQATLLGLVDRAGVVSDEAAQAYVGVLDVA